MKILWITKIDSENLTGGTRVSFYYRESLKKNFDLDLLAHYSNSKKNSSFANFIKTIIKIKKNNTYDLVVFDDHYSVFSLLFLNSKTLLFYHGNWPGLMFLSIEYFIKGLFLFPLYLIGLKFSKYIIFINPIFKKKFKKINNTSIVLFNPIIVNNDITTNERVKENILLVGNIESRKYKYFIKFLSKYNSNKYQFHIYGKTIDKKIEETLKVYKNVILKGSVLNVPYQNYKIHLSFSKSENLPLSLFEALYNDCICIYPDLENYNFPEVKNTVNFYKNLIELKELLDDESLVPTPQSSLGFIHQSYDSNLEKLIDFIKIERDNNNSRK